jgi:putative SOS response-associated peptidase YedK
MTRQFGTKLLVRVKDRADFENYVFGAESFLHFFPEILTDGVEVVRGERNNRKVAYYVINADGRKINDTAFFTAKELRRCLVILNEWRDDNEQGTD